MTDTIIFDLSNDEYINNIISDEEDGDVFRLKSTDRENTEHYIMYDGNGDTFKVHPCSGRPYTKIGMEKMTIDKEGITLELEPRDKKQSYLIKSSAANCGFKVS